MFLPILAMAHTYNIASHLNSIKTLNVVNTFKIKFKVHLNIERTKVIDDIVLIKILVEGLFEKLDLTKFKTVKSDCRFETFRLVGDQVIYSKFETITIKGKLLRYCRKYLLSFLKNI